MSREIFRRAPVAHAAVIALATVGLAGHAHAQRAFSAAWMAQKNVVQNAATTTGYLPNGTRASILTNPQAQQQSAGAQLQRSLDNLNLAARGIAAQQAAQAAARQAALTDPVVVPDGLAEGGLKVDTSSLTAGWLHANAPTQAQADGHTDVVIEQTADKAILNWETFNVGRNTTVEFKQQADWAVLNRVNDPQTRPSRIEGQIRSEGTVLVANRNGVVFSGSSQVDTRSIVAAAARIGDDQFRASGIYSVQQGGAYTPSFTDSGGMVSVEAGARISTRMPASVTQGGGYALLLGADVTNAGTITAPRGQVQLAAGDFFIVRPGQGTATNQSSTTRGNEVAPGFNADSMAGHVVNTGLLQVPEGDVTLAGRGVRQDGVVLATTTVDTRGTIHLLSSLGDKDGSVTVGQGALNAILLDDQNGRTALDSQRDALVTSSAQQDLARRVAAPGVFDNLSRLDDRLDQSRIEIVSGGGVTFDGNSTTLATGGQLAVSTAAAGRTTVAEGARLDVSGAVGVQMAMASNNVQINIQGSEQRDAPVNRDTTRLNNSNVWIDRRQLLRVAGGVGGYDKERWYTTGGLLEVGGYLGLQGHTIGEWAAQGGSMSFAGGDLATQRGSNLNLSGGTLDVATGIIRQSWMKGADGRLYEVSNAPGDVAYTGLYRGYEDTHERWGDKTTGFFASPLIGPQQRLENGYTVGRDAGRLIVATSAATLDGDVTAQVYQGPKQVQQHDAGRDGYGQSQLAVAQAGQLILGSYVTAYNADPKAGTVGVFHNLAPVLGRIVFNGPSDDAPRPYPDVVGMDPSAGTASVLVLDSARLTGFGLGMILAAANDSVRVDGALTVTPGGTIELHAPQVDVNANLTARGGSIALGNVLDTVSEAGVHAERLLLAGAGKTTGVVIDHGATLDARGLWNNLLLDPDNGSGMPFVDGGKVNVRSSGSVTLAAGTLVDVSSGAALMNDGTLKGGRGGDLTLAAAYVALPTDKPIDAPLRLDGEVRGYGVAGGGTLTIGAGDAIGIGHVPGADGTLRPGESTFVNLYLASAYVIGAGEKIPFDFTIAVRTLAPGQTLVNATAPQVSAASPLPVADAWIVPTGVSYVRSATGFFYPGNTIPAGTVLIDFVGALPAGYTIPAGAFPGGVPIAPIITHYASGAISADGMVVPAGTLLPSGSSTSVALAVAPLLSLGTDLFQRGFGGYVVQGRDGLAVGEGTVLEVSMPVLLADAQKARGTPTGASPSAALSMWTPPLYAEDPVAGVLTQRAGASLSLVSGSAVSMDRAPITIGSGAVVTVDPGQSIMLRADGQLTIEGRLNAWGGDIGLASMPANPSGLAGLTDTSVWIGNGAVLDAAARAYVAHDSRGRAYGVAPDGGTITVDKSDAYLIVRPGAVLDVSGTSAVVDAAAGSASSAASRPMALASDGGSIELHANNGIVLDGMLRANAGGPGAFGGSLAIALEHRAYDGGAAPLSEQLNQMYTIKLLQDAGASGMAADLAPGQAGDGLVFGQAVIGANQIKAGGFDSLTLSTPDRLLFEGDVDLALGRSLNLRGGILTVADAAPDAHIDITAPYIRLDGGSWLAPTLISGFAPGLFAVAAGETPVGQSRLSLSAGLIDVYGAVLSGANASQGTGTLGGSPAPGAAVKLDGFADIVLRSTGDVRLSGGLNSAGNMQVDAAQLYPTSGAYAALIAGDRRTGIAADSLLTIRSNGAAASTPYSAFGQLVLMGGTVDQGGVVRAPLGTISLNTLGGSLGTDWQGVLVLGLFGASVFVSQQDPVVILRDGSLTSVSAAGLELPFGGTVDGVTYAGLSKTGRYVTQYGLADTFVTRGDNSGTKTADSNVLVTGINIGAARLVGEPGSVIDLSGGGTLHGEGFISGRGGSVDVLKTPLVNANPALNGFSRADDGVYAILPGYASGYAPVVLDKGAGDPAIGQQISIGSGVPGLPAGTYTLLPSSFALMPGAFRVELGPQALPHDTTAPVQTAGGSWLATATQGVAGTTVQRGQATRIVLTSGQAVRDQAQYNETTFSQFLLAQADQFGAVRSRLPEDGKILNLQLAASDDVADPLSFAGTVRFGGTASDAPGAAVGGVDGQMIVSGGAAVLDIGLQAPTAPVSGRLSLTDRSLNAFMAPTLMLGGAWRYFDGGSTMGDSARIYFSADAQTGGVELHEGAVLKAGQVFLVGERIVVDQGATIDTRGFGGRLIDSSLGYVFANGLKSTGEGGSVGVLAVANGWLDFLPSVGASQAIVRDGAALLTEGSIVFAAPGALDLGDVNMGARYVSVSQDQINIGNASSLAQADAAGALRPGWHLSQDVLDRLLHPSATADVPALERLSLTAGGAFNFYGSVTLDTGSSPVQMVFNTPAFYGWGGAQDTVRIATGNFVWNGVATGSGQPPGDGYPGNPYGSAAPSAVLPGGPGSGRAQLVIDAKTVQFGYDALSQPQRQAALDRLALGFSGVTVNAADRVTANNAGTLLVSGTQAADGSRTGGDLTIVTPLLTGEGAASMKYVAGGAVRVSAPVGAGAGDTASVSALGASLTLDGLSVLLDTAVALPSGKLVVRADGEVALGDRADLDLAGRSIAFFDQTRHSWGGDVSLRSEGGDIGLSAGTTIDVSAARNHAGSLSMVAPAGAVSLPGSLHGAGGAGFEGGRLALTQAGISNVDFAALNGRLNDAGFDGARDFTIKTGDLDVGDGVRAHEVRIALDGGSLTVHGTVDASGHDVGGISLSARGDLQLTSTAVLDAHGTSLAVDGRGQAIDASNRATISLGTSQGAVRLAGGATLDLRSADDVSRGQVDINAVRTGETSGDLRIEARDPLTIRGAASVAVNGFWTYSPTDVSGSVKQNNGDAAGAPIGADGVAGLDQIDTRSRGFIDAAWANADLQKRMAGLGAVGGAFHLRPGVEIRGAGDLATEGDLDLSGYRYGPGADPSRRGSGEAGVLTLRAGGELRINGSINDGFAPPKSSPDGAVYDTVLSSVTLGADYPVPAGGITLGAGSKLPLAGSLGFDLALPVNVQIFLSNTAPLPMDVVLGGAILSNRVKANVVTTAEIVLPTGVRIPAGTNTSTLVGVIGASTANLRLPAGTVLKAGMNAIQLNDAAATGMKIAATTWRAGTNVAVLKGYALSLPTEVKGGSALPAGMFVSSALAQTGDRPIWAIAPMLGAGSQSWSMRLVGGADLAAADSRAVRGVGAGGITLNDPFLVNVSGKGLGDAMPGISVLRTGTGSLELHAAGDFEQKSPYGVYTAGTAVAGTGAGSIWNAPREIQADGTTLGGNVAARDAYLAAINPERLWYAADGGDFTLAAGGNIHGMEDVNSEMVGSWLLRQGGAGIGQATGWGINFGTYVLDGPAQSVSTSNLGLAAFSGLGTLGGGNATVRAGGDIGTDSSDKSRNIVVAVGASGRVIDGIVTQVGGGALSVSADGHVYGGLYANLRGDTLVSAAGVGVVQLRDYNVNRGGDPRGVDAYTPYTASSRNGASFAPGDGRVSVESLGDLVMGVVIDPGRAEQRLETVAALADGTQGRAATWYTLWTGNTGIDLFSAGGNVAPLGTGGFSSGSVTTYLPAVLHVVAPGGSIYFAGSGNALMPSPEGQLELLAGGRISGVSENSISNTGGALVLLGAPGATIATPLNPAWRLAGSGSFDDAEGLASNYWRGSSTLFDGGALENIYSTAYDKFTGLYTGQGGTPFVFGPNTLVDDSMAGSGVASRIYAVTGDVQNVQFGNAQPVGNAFDGTNAIYYQTSKPMRMLAGADIVNSGGLIAHGDANDVSLVAAGGSIFFSRANNKGFSILGPGTLEVSAGGDIYMGNVASFTSLGPVAASDLRPGAGIVVQAGLGAGTPGEGATDFVSFERLYLDPANLADSTRPLAEQPGKVAKTYQSELAAWLTARYGFAGPVTDALRVFSALPAAQQRIFARQVFYSELTAGGREYNDPDSRRFGSYQRGREAIATLFPDSDASGRPIVRNGDLTLFQGAVGNGGIRTVDGGAIQTLTPGGKTLVGIEGVVPSTAADVSPSGLITQGEGSIQMFSKGSILLGLSRIMTTFGGDILAWSASGDINAGRGSKTTLVYTPPKREYDDVGNVKLSPNVPSSGAGIATLDPIPEVPPGDVDLIAPLGTIDAGEAGIRVSGNVNLAALQVVNAANVQVKGQSAGLPLVASVNVGALANASAVASQAAAAAQDVMQQERAVQRQSLPSVFTVRVLSFGNERPADGSAKPESQGANVEGGYDANSPVQVLGRGSLGDAQKARLTPQERRLLGE